MPRPWSAEDLFFLRECNDSGEEWRVYAQRPHLMTLFEPLGQPTIISGRQHGRPKILALGIILLEIELGLILKDEWKSKNLRHNGQPTSNTDYCTALDLLADNPRWSSKETFPNVKDAIESCIEDRFQKCCTSTEERDAIYEKVVAPIEGIWKIVTKEPLEKLHCSELEAIEPNSPVISAVPDRSVIRHSPLSQVQSPPELGPVL